MEGTVAGTNSACEVYSLARPTHLLGLFLCFQWIFRRCLQSYDMTEGIIMLMSSVVFVSRG